MIFEIVLQCRIDSHKIIYPHRPISVGSTTKVLTAIEVESRKNVDEMVKIVLENGTIRYRDGADYEWMYYDSFTDFDKHQ